MPASPELSRYEVPNSQPESLPDSDPDLFVSDEKGFCKEHHANLERLENGATAFTMPHHVEDSMNADIQFTFPFGSRFDPANKHGLTHHSEHISLTSLVAEAMRIQTEFNGTTTSVSHDITVSGIANPHFRSIGVWPILALIRRNLADIRNIEELAPERVALELETIKEEIALKALSHDFATMRALLQLLYAPDHPYRSNILGTPEDLERITLADLEKQLYRMHHPKGTVISALTHEGKIPICPSLHETLRQVALALPEVEAPGWLPTPAEVGSVKTVEPGSLFTADTNIKNELVTAQLCWQIPATPKSTKFFAIERFNNLLNGHLFDFVRTRGLAYDFQADVFGENEPLATIIVQFDISKNRHIEGDVIALANEFQESLASEISDPAIQQAVDNEQMYQKAAPPSVQTRFELTIDGLLRHGRIIDFDEVMRRFAAITPEHLAHVRDHMASTSPTIILTGDLS